MVGISENLSLEAWHGESGALHDLCWKTIFPDAGALFSKSTAVASDKLASTILALGWMPYRNNQSSRFYILPESIFGYLTRIIMEWFRRFAIVNPSPMTGKGA